MLILNLNSIHTITYTYSIFIKTFFFNNVFILRLYSDVIVLEKQPRSQGLSSLPPLVEKRDPGNEVARKAPFSKLFPSTLKRTASVIKFLRFEERFRKAPFS